VKIARVFDGLPIRQVYAVPKATVAALDPAATRLRRPEAEAMTVRDSGRNRM